MLGFQKIKKMIMIESPACSSNINTVAEAKPKKPDWLRVKLPIGESYKHVRNLVDTHKLHTICESGNCPNMGECWGAGTATFMILGNTCTRSCGFCAVATGRPATTTAAAPGRRPPGRCRARRRAAGS